MNLLSLALRMLRRHLRAGELTLLGLALALAVGSLSSVSFFTDRLGRALAREANQMLGGDLMLSADHPWAPGFAREAARRGLSRAESLLFTSMAGHGDAVQMAGVKAVSPGYPLRGVPRVRLQPDGPERAAPGGPDAGSVWLDERLSAMLSARPGDRVRLGNSRLKVAAILSWEADRGNNFFALAPRLVMNLADVPATGLVVPGSRVTYRLHFAGEPAAVAGFQSWARAALGRGEQVEDIGSARPELRTALDRAQRYLRLAALLAVVLAAVAVGLAARRFMERNLDGCAVMRCLGASQGLVSGMFLLEFLVFGVLASAAGCALGYGAQWALERILAGLIGVVLPLPSPLPLVQGLAVGLALLGGFVVPSLLRLSRVSTLRVLRREWQPGEPRFLAGWGAGLAVLVALMFWIADDIRLGALVCAGFAAALGLYAIAATALLSLARRVRGAGSGWRLGLAALARRRGAAVLQTVALALGLTALLLLGLARDDLLAAWRQSVPPDAPNRFVINIQPEERQAVRNFFVARGLRAPDLLPMVRGRLAAVNGQPLNVEAYGDERARHLAEREFNLSWADRLPAGNTVVDGAWFAPGEKDGLSVEQGLAKTLGLKLGDRLAFDIAGSPVEGRITSLRKLEWDSMRVNFFVITPPGVLEGAPASYIMSFHLEPGQAALGRDLVAAIPTLTLIDVAAILQQLQDMLGQLGLAVQFVFLFTLGAGLLVLFAALEATFDERTRELAVLRTLGARHRQLRLSLAVEFAAMGLAAGLLAVLGAGGMGWALARFVFKLPWLPNPVLMAVSLGLSVAGVALCGVLGLSGALRRPVVEALRV